ncbi:helix-turn-helix domain-containing protein [Rhizorhabdus histidinilytica]
MLRLARQRLGFTQKAAASRLGVAQPVLSRFENGPVEPDDAFLHKAASVYDLPRDSLTFAIPFMGLR